MLALPFLPENEIQPMFNPIQPQAPITMQPFTEYVSSNWIHGTTWSPSDWTVFNKATAKQLPLYLLIQLLHRRPNLLPYRSALFLIRNLRESSDASTVSFRPNHLTYGRNTRPTISQVVAESLFLPQWTKGTNNGPTKQNIKNKGATK